VRRLHAEALMRQGRLSEAEAELRTTQANLLGISRADHPGVATTRVLLGVALARRGDLAGARQQWNDAAPLLARALGPSHPYSMVAACYAALAAPAGSPQAVQRPALADQLQHRLGWQDGVPALLALLRAGDRAPDWRHLPVVL
jgi:ATP/maltotriose-dependent transcriptional regulator MalT